MRDQFRIAPDWVMLGVSAEDGVYVYASSDLTQAELEAVADEMEMPTDGWFRRFEVINRRYIITATMKTITIAKGDTYGEAIRNLFGSWTPPEPESKGLPEGPRGLPEGDRGTPVVPELFDGRTEKS
jgi:hypothetical protein